MTDEEQKKRASPDWIPRQGRSIRWDRSIAVGDVAFRWHTRLDGTAILHGPAGKLAIGDTLPRPVGHLHGKDAGAPVLFMVSEIYDTADGQSWIKVSIP